MILTWSKIIEEVQNKNIILEPFDISQINPNSYNYRLGNRLRKFDYIDNEKHFFFEEEIPETWYKLVPHQLYLAATFETIGSSKYMISLIGRSSMGRLWLFLQLSANIGHTGTCHKWTLELVSTKPFIIYPYMKIGQVSFWVNQWEVIHYDGLYNKFDNPQESLLSLH